MVSSFWSLSSSTAGMVPMMAVELWVSITEQASSSSVGPVPGGTKRMKTPSHLCFRLKKRERKLSAIQPEGSSWEVLPELEVKQLDINIQSVIKV